MRSRRLAGVTGVLAVAAALTTACGGDDGQSASGNETDRAFVAGMVPHHELAIDMAKVAKERSQSQFVNQLADDIIAAQREEIKELKRVDAQLVGEGVDVGELGVPEHLSGMEEDMAALETAQPFDRVFIDMMIPHHAGAIRMARVETEEGENAQLVELAHAIIEAQSREIRAMNEHRAQEFGEASPAGGVPPEGEETPAPEHEGH